jgi:ribosomal protein S18 acetylase RimI-like enzyme
VSRPATEAEKEEWLQATMEILAEEEIEDAIALLEDHGFKVISPLDVALAKAPAPK